MAYQWRRQNRGSEALASVIKKRIFKILIWHLCSIESGELPDIVHQQLKASLTMSRMYFEDLGYYSAPQSKKIKLRTSLI